ncbi:hypothetical protein H2200_005345 [Cladophialophora chaetospira]|uniref:Uncharacterized protein n=1 Tax=Cladophialophora chaetospira TaxID=386627 RepID=A0AA38XBT6_9EURO|nr:hypothetical protein H2200_005345 [Cladophialophora chaetospira]
MAFPSTIMWPLFVTTPHKGEFALGYNLQTLFNLQQDTELAFSNNSALRSGLPFAFLTHDLNYIPSSIILQRAPPPYLEVIKYYFRPQFEELELRFHNVEVLGAATLGEWKKGLESSGHERYADSTRFEQWELQRGFSRALSARDNTAIFATTEPLPAEGRTPPKFDRLQKNPSRSAAGTPSSGHVPLEISNAGSVSGESQYTAGKSSNGVWPNFLAATEAQSHQDILSQTSSRLPRQRPERSLKEATEARAERRKEIERRCLALNPPIMPSTLAYMDAFRAAILISLPLDDKAWDVLRPRLLSQRTEAEQRELQTTLSDPSIQQVDRQQLEEEQRVARENSSQMWHALKIPSREKIRRFTEEFIQITWSNGQAVTKSTASKFAAEVLSHIRQRFDESIAQEDQMLALKGTAFPQDPASMSCRKLILQDMKWAFVEFVQPHTQRFGKDLFLCHVCDTNQKLFAFEAIIQHFASKHTSALSHGNSIVSWEADWPIEPPFDPHPNILWALGGNTSAKPRPNQQSLPNLPSRGISSFVGGVSEPRSTFSSYIPPTEGMTNPQIPRPSSRQRPKWHDARHVEPFSPRFGAGNGPGHVSHASATRSEASGIAMEDDGHGRFPVIGGPNEGRSGPRSHAGESTGSNFGFAMAYHHPFRVAAHRGQSPRSLDHGRDWGSWREAQPLSESSVVYSHDGGSSTLSYGGSHARPRGTRSRTGRDSTAPSHTSLHRGNRSEAGTSHNEQDSSRTGIDTFGTKDVVEDFLNSFDPLASTGTSGTGRAELPGTPEHRLRPSMTTSRPFVGSASRHSGWDALSSPPTSHISSFSPPQQRASLPIREIERRPVDVMDPLRYPRHSPQLAHGYDVTGGLAAGSRQSEERLEHRPSVRYGDETESTYDRSSAFVQPVYERRYIYDREGRRYEEIREMDIERHPLQQDTLSERSRESYAVEGRRYVDERGYFLDQAYGREAYSREVPRAYRVNDIEYSSHQNREPLFESRYRGEELLGPEHRTRTIRYDDHDITYQPVESPRRTASRSLGMSRPEE